MSIEKIGAKLRKLREGEKLPLRKVASLLKIDVAILSKMERGDRPLTKKIVTQLAGIYNHDTQELIVLYLSSKIIKEVEDEELALKAIIVAEKQIKYQTKRKAK